LPISSFCAVSSATSSGLGIVAALTCGFSWVADSNSGSYCLFSPTASIDLFIDSSSFVSISVEEEGSDGFGSSTAFIDCFIDSSSLSTTATCSAG